MNSAFCYKNIRIKYLSIPVFFLLAGLLLMVTVEGSGQCANPPIVTLTSLTGSTCGTTSITVSGNTFGGAKKVTISENGSGSVSPTSLTTTPFTFTYTPKSQDGGKMITITVTTDNPLGSPCTAAKAIYILSVYDNPSTPHAGTITRPTCVVATGSVSLSSLPSAGIWIVTRNPGAVINTGTGTTTTLSGIPAGTYSFTVTNSMGCTSSALSGIIIPSQPVSPEIPVQTIDCKLGFGKAVVKVLSPIGTGLQYQLDGGSFQSGTSFSNVTNANHTITVRNSSGCTKTGPSFQVSCGCTNQPSVSLTSTTGSSCVNTPVTISGNTFGGSATSVTLTHNGTGTISTATAVISPFAFTYTPVSGDAGKTVTITVMTNNPGGSPCVAAIATYSLIVNASPSTPVAGAITQPTCYVATGSVELSSLPSVGTWTITRTPGGVTTTGAGTSTTLSGILPGTYTYTITSSVGCTSSAVSGIIIPAQPALPEIPTQTINCNLGLGKAVVTVTSPTGTGLQYQLDGGSFQSETSFSNVTNASHTITVKNSYGCITTGPGFQISCGCTNQPLVSLTSASGSSCVNTPVTISGNTFGGSATSVTITHNGTGTVSPVTAVISPFEFAYTPSSGDAGKTVTITVMTNNPVGSTCVAATATYSLIVNTSPSPPVVGLITQPTCYVASGSVELSGLPSVGIWRLTHWPGGLITQGNGTTTTMSGLPYGTNTFTITNVNNCTSVLSENVIINATVSTPAAPVVSSITQPTCTVSTGSVLLSGLPPTGTWILTRYPGTITLTGTGTSTTISGLPVGMYNFMITNSIGCISGLSANILIQTEIPSAPQIGIITQPSNEIPTGSVDLSGLPSVGNWTLTLYPGNITTSGAGISRTISGLTAGTYSFTVTNFAGCISTQSSSFTINPTQSAPLVLITQPAPVCGKSITDLTDPKITSGSTPNLIYTYWTNANATIPYNSPLAAPAGTYYIKGTNAAGFFQSNRYRLLIISCLLQMQELIRFLNISLEQ